MKTITPLTSVVALLTAALLVGCGSEPENTASNAASNKPSATVESGGTHDHPSEGPHGGDLIELGNEEYHAELIHPENHDDDAKPREGADHKDGDDADHDHLGITIYILDGTAKKMVPIDAVDVTVNLSHDGKPEQFKLAAMPTESDPEGKSSRFASDDKDLLEHFHEEDVQGTLVLRIDGKSYRGKLAHSHAGHGHKGHGHTHSGDDALVWRRDVEHAGYAIRLGHHGKHLHAGKPVEPAISITRDGKPISDAKVFNSLIAEDKQTIAAEEAATVYEPPTSDEPAHYAQGALAIPKDAKHVVIRYRIALPNDAGEVTYDVPVDVE